MKRIPLPIDSILPQIVAGLIAAPSLVLQATPGSGKTTRVPPALLDSELCRGGKEVIVLEPRRLAAKFAALRVAQERGESVGDSVGYQFRFEKAAGPNTRLRFLTEGMLFRRLIDDPKLKNTAVVILDEFHERHLQGDLALAYLRDLQKSSRPDLRIVVMSATLEMQSVAKFLGCATLELETPRFPVDIDYLSFPPARLDTAVVDGVRRAFGRTASSGDALVFLPGISDMRRCETSLENLKRTLGFEIFLLHGDLPKEEQERALTPQQKRKVILSTNVAETSLTIEGVNLIIDGGLHRQAAYSWWSGVPSLRTRPISRASAIQRAGRAGRTGPGYCLRLYTKSDFDGRPAFDTPEIHRTDLAQSLLELKNLGIENESQFGWFEPPSDVNLEAARLLLYRLGALATRAPGAPLTALGKRLAKFPASPRIAKMMIEGEKRGVKDEVATLGALISEGDLDRLDAVEAIERANVSRRAKLQLLSSLNDSYPVAAKDRRADLIAQSVLAAFPDRIARRRDAARGKIGDHELVFSSGGSARVEDSPLLRSYEYFVVLDVQQTQYAGQARAELKVRAVCPVLPEWLFDVEPMGPEEKEVLVWNASKERVSALSQLVYGDLVLTESQGEPNASDVVSAMLLKALGIEEPGAATLLFSDWVTKLSPIVARDRIEAVLAKLQLMMRFFGSETKDIGAIVRRAMVGKTSFAELRAMDWQREILDAVAGEKKVRTESLFPESVTLPGGRKTPIQYNLDRDPWIESRLQDFFGMAQGPSILNGRMPLTLHLFAPNYRAVQVTTDLTGFWERAYPALRKEFSRKYPRHSWPEDPKTAIPPKPHNRPRRN